MGSRPAGGDRQANRFIWQSDGRPDRQGRRALGESEKWSALPAGGLLVRHAVQTKSGGPASQTTGVEVLLELHSDELLKGLYLYCRSSKSSFNEWMNMTWGDRPSKSSE